MSSAAWPRGESILAPTPPSSRQQQEKPRLVPERCLPPSYPKKQPGEGDGRGSVVAAAGGGVGTMPGSDDSAKRGARRLLLQPLPLARGSACAARSISVISELPVLPAAHSLAVRLCHTAEIPESFPGKAHTGQLGATGEAGTGAALGFGVWVCIPHSSSMAVRHFNRVLIGFSFLILDSLGLNCHQSVEPSPVGDTGMVTGGSPGSGVSPGGEERLRPVTLRALLHIPSPLQGPDGTARAPSRAAAG